MQSHTKVFWKIRLQTIIWLVLILGFFSSLPVILNWPVLYVYILIASFLFAIPFGWLITKFCNSHTLKTNWLRCSLGLFFFSTGIASLPIYYSIVITETKPALQPQTVLVNGDKTVIFQGMQHIGSENFYKSVIYDVEEALANGFVIYYEGVQTNSPASKKFFEKITAGITGGQKDLAKTYSAIGKACGLKFQMDYFGLLDADKKEHPERHIIADVDALELKAEFNRLMKTDKKFARENKNFFKVAEQESKDDPSAAFVSFLKSGSEGQKKLAGIVCRGFMSKKIGESDSGKVTSIEPVILDYRNNELAKRIINDSNKKIFVTYGAKHLSGVLELLKENDPNWEVRSVKWMRTIETPKKNYKGKL
ncbi:hypothetical protein ACRXCV_14625 [Halobacteriovorax sp. GFR7]|uniref:hypothetical protein n=1 Tax=unclassified Halobacteriovorax TaxID=2639665 RepID=UPI003D98AF6C